MYVRRALRESMEQPGARRLREAREVYSGESFLFLGAGFEGRGIVMMFVCLGFWDYWWCDVGVD